MNWKEYLALEREVKASLGDTLARSTVAPPLGQKPGRLVDQRQMKAEYGFPFGEKDIHIDLPDGLTLHVDETHISRDFGGRERFEVQALWGEDPSKFTAPAYVQRMLEGNPYGLYVETLKSESHFWVRRGRPELSDRHILERDNEAVWLRFEPISEGTLTLDLGIAYDTTYFMEHDLTPGHIDAILEGSSLMLIYDPVVETYRVVERASVEATLSSAKAELMGSGFIESISPYEWSWPPTPGVVVKDSHILTDAKLSAARVGYAIDEYIGKTIDAGEVRKKWLNDMLNEFKDFKGDADEDD